MEKKKGKERAELPAWSRTHFSHVNNSLQYLTLIDVSLVPKLPNARVP
jgi:hypothetical protein